MNDINDIVNDMNDIVNDKKPFPLHEESWYRTALLKKCRFVLSYLPSR